MDRRTFISSAAVAIVAAQASPTLAEVPKHFVGSVEKRVDLPTWQIRSWGNRTYEFSPKSTALIVIDMQKDFFVGEDGRYVPELAAIVPRVSRLVKTLRARGCRVFHTREGYAPDLSDVSPYKQSLDYVGRQGSLGRYLIRGEAGHDFLDELRPSSQNTIIEKAGFSAFLWHHVASAVTPRRHH